MKDIIYQGIKYALIAFIAITLLNFFGIVRISHSKEPRKIDGLKLNKCKTQYFSKLEFHTKCRVPNGLITYKQYDLGGGDISGNVEMIFNIKQ
jgi:hypothetical protein